MTVKRFVAKETWQQLKEVDYLEKLSASEQAWLKQFYMEYYQADFNYKEPIHPREYRKDCQTRNNHSKRQLHAISSEKLMEILSTPVKGTKKNRKMLISKYYALADYSQENQDDTEN